MELELGLDEGRDVDRLRLDEIPDAMLGTEVGELPDCLSVGAASVGVSNMRAEEVAHPGPGFRSLGEDRGQGNPVRNERIHNRFSSKK